MSGLINSLLINPVVRQARRISSTRNTAAAPAEGDAGRSHVNLSDDATAISREPHGKEEYDDVPLGEGSRSNHRHGDWGNNSETVSARVPEVARANGLQGLIPMDDMRSNYIFDQTPVASPTDERDFFFDESQNTTSGPINAEQSTMYGLNTMSLDEPPSMTANPSFGVPESLRTPEAGSLSSARSHLSLDRTLGMSDASSGERSSASSFMSGMLPADDGMRAIREQIHQIREMALSADEKAKQMHALMVSDYTAFKKAQAESSTQDADGKPARTRRGRSRRSTGAELSGHPAKSHSIDPLYTSPEDLQPTYRPRTPPNEISHARCEPSDDVEDEELMLGCKHYMRNVKIQCFDCLKWYTCRHCHDEAEDHALNRKATQRMLCMLCGTPQAAGEYCQTCGEVTAAYYCDICKLWDNDGRHRIYHCIDCGICRRGEGLGKDYVHCKKCNVCIAINWAAEHRCVERATECDCPICGEYMFTSSASVVAMRCGHYIHRTCYDAYMQTSYKCPICNRSAVNMELQWRKLDLHIEAQPMPEQYAKTKAWVTCNDCSAKTCVNFHWLGNKCAVCDSYNTIEMRLENGPSGEEAEGLHEEVRPRAPTVTSTDVVIQAPVAVLRSFSTENSGTDVAQTAQDTVTTSRRSRTTARASSASILNDVASAFIASTPPHMQSHTSRSPTNTLTTTTSNGTTVTALNSPHAAYAIGQVLEDEIEMTDIDAENSTATTPGETEDEASFWGDGIRPPNGWPNLSISPGQWARSISPSGWRVGSPSFLATGTKQTDADGDESMGESSDEDDDDDDEDDERHGEGGEGEGVEQGEGEDEWELFGHR